MKSGHIKIYDFLMIMGLILVPSVNKLIPEDTAGTRGAAGEQEIEKVSDDDDDDEEPGNFYICMADSLTFNFRMLIFINCFYASLLDGVR